MKSRLLNETHFLYIAHMDCIYFREPTKMQSRKKKLFEFQMLRVLALLRTMRTSDAWQGYSVFTSRIDL